MSRLIFLLTIFTFMLTSGACKEDHLITLDSIDESLIVNRTQDGATVKFNLDGPSVLYYVVTEYPETLDATQIMDAANSGYANYGMKEVMQSNSIVFLTISNLKKFSDYNLNMIVTSDNYVSPSKTIPVYSLLTDAANDAQSTENLQSLIVSLRDTIILERYYNGYDSTDFADVRSVTKSITSMLIGIALDEGKIKSLDETIADYLPSKYIDGLSGEKKAITIRNLLTMSSGLYWDESKYKDWTLSDDEVSEMLNRPLVSTPGSTWYYNTGAVHLLSAILTSATGKNSLQYGIEKLFDPLGIKETPTWEIFETGYNNGGSGFAMHPKSYIKIGQLFLHHGYFNSRQIISENYVNECITKHFNLNQSKVGILARGYGYLWWIMTGSGYDAFMAWGYGGQYIYCVPDLDLVVATTAKWRGTIISTIGIQETAVMNVVQSAIKAVK